MKLVNNMSFFSLGLLVAVLTAHCSQPPHCCVSRSSSSELRAQLETLLSSMAAGRLYSDADADAGWPGVASLMRAAYAACAARAMQR